MQTFFPGEVAYPYALFMGGAQYTDLMSNFASSQPMGAISCPGFGTKSAGPGPTNCNVPFALPTSAGDLTIDTDTLANPQPTGLFSTQIGHR